MDTLSVSRRCLLTLALMLLVQSCTVAEQTLGVDSKTSTPDIIQLANISLTEQAISTTEPRAECKAINFNPMMYFPDSMRLLGTSNKSVVAINMANGEQELTLDAPQMVVRATISPNGEILAWALEDNTIQLVRLADGEVINTMSGHTQVIDALKFSSDGTRLFSGSYDGFVKIWDSQGNLVDELFPGGMEVMGLANSPDGSKLATITFEGPQKLWDMATKEIISELSPSGASSPAEAMFSADGETVGIAQGGGPVTLWKVPEGNLIWSGGNFALALSADGKYMAYSDVNEDGSNKIVLSTTDGKEIIRTLAGGFSFAWRLFFSPDSKWLVEGSDVIRIWDVSSGEPVYVFKDECP